MDNRTRAMLQELRSDLSYVTLEQLPAAIVECFTKLWLESCETTTIEELVPKDYFRPVFESMNNVFSEDAPREDRGCTGICQSLDESIKAAIACDICDEDYPITNNDVKYSYFAHTQTAKHMETVRTFQSEMISAAEQNDMDGITPRPSCSYQNNYENAASSRSVADFIESSYIENGIIEDDEGLHVCFVCNEVLECHKEVRKHMASVRHSKNMEAQNYTKSQSSTSDSRASPEYSHFSKSRISRESRRRNKHRSYV